jgi:hypothetical protein
VLLGLVRHIEGVRFAHPKDVQDGLVPVTTEDIIVNLPFVSGCGMWFDHHLSEARRLQPQAEFTGRFEVAPSAARVIRDYYRHPGFERFGELLEATDRFDSAMLEVEDVTDPRGWILLGCTMDPRTGLGPEFQWFFCWLQEFVGEAPLEEVLAHPEVRRRCELVRQQDEAHLDALRRRTRRERGVIVTDLRGLRDFPVENRFLVYTLYPEGNVEARVHDGKDCVTINVAIGHSNFDRTCQVNAASLCARYGGGGHRSAGAAQLTPARAEEQIAEILEILRRNEPLD